MLLICLAQTAFARLTNTAFATVGSSAPLSPPQPDVTPPRAKKTLAKQTTFRICLPLL